MMKMRMYTRSPRSFLSTSLALAVLWEASLKPLGGGGPALWTKDRDWREMTGMGVRRTQVSFPFFPLVF